MKRRSAIDNLRPWAAWMVRRRMWVLVYVVGLVVGTVIAAAVAAWEVFRQVCSAETFREAWRDLRQAARDAAEERAAKCRCVDCGGSEPAHSAECEYMAELHGDGEQAVGEVKP